MKKLLFLNGFLILSGGSYLYLTKGRVNLNNSSPDFQKIKKEVQDILWNDSYEDKHIGPLLVRLAWHASGTYDKNTNTGGSNGATMRFNLEAQDGANAGLGVARMFLDPIKKNNPNVSYADLWIFASYVAIESMGGPNIEFSYGRSDALDGKECPPNGRLPDATKDRSHIREVFNRMGFNDQEIVALVGGGHTIGRCHIQRSGFEGPWTFNPLGFSNMFFKELYEKNWEIRNWKGPKQYEDKETKKLMMLPTDLELRDDPEFAKWSKLYKEDEKKFFDDFAKSYKKLTELGCKNLKKL